MMWMVLFSNLAVAEDEAPDRSAPPPVVFGGPWALPEPDVHELGPGLQGWHVRVPDVRKVSIHLVFGRGMVELDGQATETARAMGWMLDVAGGDYKAEALSLTADLHEVELTSRIGLHDGVLSMVSPKEELAVGLSLLEALIAAPSFPGRDLKRHLRDTELYYTVEAPASLSRLADTAVSFAWFGPDHGYGARPNLRELSSIRRSDLQRRWETYTSRSPLTAVVVGDVDWDEVEGPLRNMLSGVGAAVPLAVELEVPEPASSVVAIDLTKQTQTAIRLRMAAPPQNHSDHLAMRTVHWAMGGHFLSRLNRVLREEKDFTYGARSRYLYGSSWGNFTVSVTVATENVAETVEVIEKLIAEMVEGGPTEEEVTGLVRREVRNWNSTLQSAEGAASLYLEALDHRWTIPQMRAAVEDLAKITPEQGAAVARKWLGKDARRVWVMVGERASLEPELAAAGLGAEWTTPLDAVLGNF